MKKESKPDIRKIIHIDMDAFYAAVEQRDHPELKGKPVIISGPPDSRSVVSTCSYEARRFGIHSAMPSSHAYRRCPQGIFIPPDIKKYKIVSRIIRDVFYTYTSKVEPLSLDEAYLDVTDVECPKDSATLLAMQIKQDIFEKTQLTASAGISTNKFLAKIASDWEKPDGLTTIPPGKEAEFLDRLPIGKFYGIGKKTAQKMRSLGIQNGFDLKQVPLYELLEYFGKSGQYYFDVVRGLDDREVESFRERKSIGRETTFQYDLISREEIDKQLNYLLDEVLSYCKKNDYKGKTLTFKIKYCNFKSSTRSVTLNHYLTDKKEIMEQLASLSKKTDLYQTPVRLLGITFSQLNTEKESPDRQMEFPF